MYMPPVDGLTTAHFGVFWDRHLRDRYPRVSDQPAAPPQPIEVATGGPVTYPQFVFGPAVMGRHWYATDDQTRLVQMQQDRLVLNWRKLEGDVYPHYAELRDELVRVSELWAAFLVDAGFSPMMVTQTEVTYVNQIQSPSSLGALEVRWPEDAGVADSFQFEQRFTLPLDDAGIAVGRMYISLSPVMQSDPPRATLNLVFRGPGGATPQVALQWIDIGHNQIVNTFRDVLTHDARRFWGGDA